MKVLQLTNDVTYTMKNGSSNDSSLILLIFLPVEGIIHDVSAW